MIFFGGGGRGGPIFLSSIFSSDFNSASNSHSVVFFGGGGRGGPIFLSSIFSSDFNLASDSHSYR
jgi:hypothetical protein